MTTTATAVQPEYVTLPFDRIRESTTNPRQHFDDLTESPCSNDQLEVLSQRSHPTAARVEQAGWR